MEHDRLCLACSSSVRAKGIALYITRCCSRVICDSCVRANPRLTRYDPCLACQGSVKAPTTSSQPNPVISRAIESVRSGSPLSTPAEDEDTEDQDIGVFNTLVSPPRSSSPAISLPDHEAVSHSANSSPTSTSLLSLSDTSPPTSDPNSESSSRTYYIKSTDTIHGIALRFGIEARELCLLNKLPPSTLSTTPHLLHTRVFLELPPSSKPLPLQYVLTEEDRTRREAQRARERTEKRLQMITKEVDWRVAKAYVALAGDPEITDEFTSRPKEGSEGKSRPSKPAAGSSSAGLEAVALEMYLEDEEWEQTQGSPQLHRFPSQRAMLNPSEKSTKPTWWPWKS